MTRNQLKQMWFNLPTSTIVTKTMETRNGRVVRSVRKTV